jgi:hypothetical protein
MPASGVAVYEDVAKEFLWNWTGKVFGVCEVTIRPCQQGCSEGHSSFFGSGPQRSMGLSGLWTPVIIDGLWYNIGCGRCGDKCGCGGGSPLRLPGPIQEVVSITEDGTVLDPSNYYVENNRNLVRIDGKRWAECGLEVTYKMGTPVPVGGQVAAARLALEFARAACGDSKCELPRRVQTVARQGVTIAMLDAFDDIDKGHTGIWIIDSWVASVTKSPVQSRVLSPDIPRSRYRRTT